MEVEVRRSLALCGLCECVKGEMVEMPLNDLVEELKPKSLEAIDASVTKKPAACSTVHVAAPPPTPMSRALLPALLLVPPRRPHAPSSCRRRGCTVWMQ